MPNLRTVRPGSPVKLSASDWNTFIEMAKAYKSRHGRDLGIPSVDELRVRNSSGADVVIGDVLAISDTAIDPAVNLAGFKDAPALVAITPATADHLTKLVIALTPAVDGKFFQAAAAGVCAAQVAMSDSSHTSATIDGTTRLLQSAASGPISILWVESGTGTKWAVVRIGGGGNVIGSPVSGLLTSDLAGDGFYGGKSFQPISADVDGSEDLTEAMLGGLAAEEDCVVANVTELGSSATGHDVTETVNTDRFAIYFVGICRYVNADGKKLVEAAQFYVGCADA